ncbi:hypothetical protein RhiirB3_448274 [Rhizophagus irregularis]|nr:hypothetical protein RhiirB3_448274 [Rhizophagus irregularis]
MINFLSFKKKLFFGISFNFCFRSYHRCFELVTGFVIVLLIDMNQLQLFALDQ